MKKGLLLLGAYSTLLLGVNAQNFKSMSAAKANALIIPNQETAVNAQQVVDNRTAIWQNDFSVPSDWTTGNETNGLQGQWVIVTNAQNQQLVQFMGAMQSTTAANGYASFNGVQFLTSQPPNVLPQNAWIGTAQDIDLSDYEIVTLQFQQRYRAFNTDRTFVELSTDGGNTWTTREINQDVPTNDPSVQNTISLNYIVNNSENVRVRFRWFNESTSSQFGSGYGWMVDDVKIFKTPDHDITITEVSYGEYTKIPLGQENRPIALWAKVRNDGAKTQTNVTVSAAVNGNPIGSSPAVSIPIFTTDSLGINNPYTPTGGLGLKNIVYTATQDSVDANPSGNTKTETIEVTQNLFSRDKSNYSGTGYGDFTVDGERIAETATPYEIIANGNVTSIQFVLSSSTQVGALLQGFLYDNNFNVIASTDFYTVTASNINGQQSTNNPIVVRLEFENGIIPVQPGFYLPAVAQLTDETVSIAVSNGVIIEDNVFIRQVNGTTWFRLLNGVQPMIRLGMNEPVSVSEVNSVSTLVNVFPNPTSDILNIKVKNAVGNVNIKLFNMNGQEVYNEVVNANAKNFMQTISTNGLAKGIYTLKVVAKDAISTQKVIVK